MASTYHDLYRIQKETITINSGDRSTNQLVSFMNPGNIYKGTLIGDVNIQGTSLVSTFMEEVSSKIENISNDLSSIYQKKGNYLSCYEELSVGFKPIMLSGQFTNHKTFRFYVLSSMES